MPDPRITKNAEHAPGVCVMSGDNEGPFLDTGRNLPRYGRVYVSLKHAQHLLRRIGWITEEDAAMLTQANANLLAENGALRAQAERLDDLVAAIAPFVPEPEPVERQVVKTVTREITDLDIEAFLKRNPSVLKRFKPAEAGSVDEWNSLYRPDAQKPAPEAPASPSSEGAPPTPEGSGEDGGPPEAGGFDRFIYVDGVEIDLDEVLAENVETISAYAEGHPEIGRALALREAETRPKGDPRKTVLRLGEAVPA